MARISNRDKAIAYAAEHDFHGHTHPTCDKNIVRADIEHTFEVGYFHANCNGCGEIVRTGGTLYAATRQLTN